MNKTVIKKNSGFTLVESLFAVFILTFTIAGLMTIVANSLFSARYSKDEITVNYLLQETIDDIRNNRDATVFLGSTWSDFRTHYESCFITLVNTKGCYFDVINDRADKIKACSPDDCPFMFYDAGATNGSFYNYNSSYSVTSFKRKIVFTENSLGSDPLKKDEIIVTVTVSWKNGSIPVSRSLSTSITNWR